MFTPPHDMLLILCGLLTSLAAHADLRHGKIPNRLVLAGGALGLLARLLVPLSIGEAGSLWLYVVDGLLGTFAAAFVPAIMFSLKAIGAGDVKLLASCGLLLGPVLGCELAFYAFGFGAIYALLRFSFDGSLLRVLSASAVVLTNPVMPRGLRRAARPELLGSICFAPAIAVAALTILVLHWSDV
jgi:prepilin peptidase CpaA